jgi:hypothetical protein
VRDRFYRVFSTGMTGRSKTAQCRDSRQRLSAYGSRIFEVRALGEVSH